MDALSLKIVLLGVGLIVAGSGADIALEVSGHAGSELVPVLVKVVTAGLGIVSLVLAGASGQGPNPPKTLRELLRGKASP